jgi:hypothetical protein
MKKLLMMILMTILMTSCGGSIDINSLNSAIKQCENHGKVSQVYALSFFGASICRVECGHRHYEYDFKCGEKLK